MRALHNDIPAIYFVDDEIYLRFPSGAVNGPVPKGIIDLDMSIANMTERKRHLVQLWVAYLPQRRRTLSPLLEEQYRYVEAGGIPAKG